MKRKKRLLSFIMVFCMIAGLFSNSYVYAYSDTESRDVSFEESANEAPAAYPAFHPEPVTLDGVEIKVSADEGVFPESAVLSVNKPKASEEKKIENIIEEERSGTEKVAASYTYDIKVLDADGNELQPEDGQKVEVSFSMAEVSNTNLDTNVYHISEDKSGELSADTLHVSENDDTVTAETDGFSYYTVEFTYNEKQYVMEGDSSVALTDILSCVGITKADGNVATDSDITAVSVSDESLFSASNESGEWIVTAHQAFHTDEWLKVTVDGVEYEIVVTDATTWYVDQMTVGQIITFVDGEKVRSGNTGTVYPSLGIYIDDVFQHGSNYCDSEWTIGNYASSYSTWGFPAGTYKVLSFGTSGATGFLRLSTDISQPAEISFENTSISKTYGNGSFTNVVSNSGDGSVTYSSNKTTVATVDSSSGQVTIKGVGSATITATVTDTDYYTYATKTATYTLTVNKANISPSVSMSGWTYGGTASNPSVSGNSGNGSVSYEYYTNSGCTTKTTTANGASATGRKPSYAGNYWVKATIAATTNYNSGTATKSFTISKKSLTVTAKSQTITYGNSITTGTGQVTTATLASGDSLSAITLTPSTSNVTTSGTITPSAATIKNGSTDVTGNYNITYNTGTLTINKANLAVTAKPKTIIYGDAPANDGVTYSGFVNGDSSSALSGTLSYTYNYSQYGNIGSYTITPSGLTSNNYNITFNTGTLTVNQKEVGLSWTDTALTYNGSPQKPTTTATGTVNSDSIGVTVTGEQTNAGNYTATASALTGAKAGNYKLPSANTQSFSIGTASMAEEVEASDYSGTYDGQAHGITVTAPEGATVKYRTTGSGDYTLTNNPTFTNAGTYTVYYQVTKPNYTTVEGSETVVIDKIQLELSWDDSTRAFTYDGASHKPSASITGVLGDDDCGVAVSGEQTDYSVSAYTATASLTGEQKDNYVLPTEHTTTFTIAKREVTVTAKSQTVKLKDDISRTVNDAELSGAVEGHTLSEIAFEAVDTTSTTTVGNERDILPKDAVIKNGNTDVTNNYDITFVKGLLTVEKKVPTYTPPVANTLTYNGDAQVLIQAGDSEDDTVMWYRLENGEWTSDYSAITATHADTYTVYYKVVGNSNFEDVFSDDEPESLIVTIDKKDITISGIEVNTKTYDGNTTTTLDYSHVTYGGIEAGDSLTVTATGTFEDAGADVNKSVEISDIVLGGTSINDYKLAVMGQQTAAIATIEPKEVGLEWHIGDTVYDGIENIPAFTFNGKAQKPSAIAAGLIEGDVCNVTVSGEQTNAGNNYTAEASALDNANYKLPAANTIPFIIKPKTITKNDITFGHSEGLQAGNYEYTGDVIKPEITVSTVLAGDTGVTDLVLDTDYTMSRDTTAISTGTHYIKFDGKGNYDGTVYLPWYIAAKTVTVTAEAKSKVYGDDDPEFTVTVSGAPAEEISYNYIGRDTAENDDDKENVEDHAIVVTGDAAQGDYNVVFVNGTLTFTQAPVTDKADNMSKTYGDEDPEELTTTMTGLKRNDDRSKIVYDIARTEGENAGSYTITPAGAASQGNYHVTYSTGTFKINKRKLSADFVGLDKVSFQANGDNHSPNVVFSKYTPVTLDTDYRVSGETTANDAGVHEITVTGIGTNFTGSVVLPWYITGVGDKEVTYDGQPHTIVAGDGETNITFKREKTDTDYTLTAPPEYTNAGSYTIYYKTTVANPMYGYIEGEGETLDVEGTAVLTIHKAPLTVTADNKTKVYGDADPELTYTVSGIISGETVSDAVTGALTRTAGQNVGTYDITQGTLAGTANYKITTYNPATLTITLKPLNPACFDVKLGPDTLNKNTVVYNAGPWAVTATAATGIEGLGTITPRYFKVDGETETETTPSGTAPTDAGKYRVRLEVSEGTNYSGTGSEAAGLITTDDWWFEIVKAPFPADTVDANWPTANTGLEYRGSAQALLTAPTTALSGYTMNYRIDDGEWGTDIPTGKDAVGYTVYAKYVSTDPANRLDSEERSYTVSVAPRPITVTADDKSKTYGTDDPELTYTITAGSLVGDEILTGVLEREEGENVRAGGYAITAGTLTNDNNPNYDITFVPGTFTIARAAITPSVSIADWIYGDTASVPVVSGNTGNGEVTYTYAVKDSSDFSDTVPTDVGEYTIKASIEANGNCEAGQATADFVITKKQVEVAAENKEKEYGSEDPELTYTVTAKNGADEGQVLSNGVLSGLTIARAAGKDVSDTGYAITVSQSDGANPNYDVSFVPGTFIITRKAVTVTADDKTKVYGEDEPASFTATVEGLVGDDSIDYSVARDMGENVGEYAITPVGDVTQGNYTVSYAAGTFTITKAALAVTAEEKSKTYGETDPDLTYAVDGLANGDTSAVITGSLSRASGENAGIYAIGQGTLSAGDNYIISYTGANFTIGKKTLTIISDAKSKTYGYADPSLTYNAEGFENGDTVETVMSGALARVEGEDVRDGGYAILQGTLSAGNNYNISYTGADFTITKRNLTLTSASDTKAYDGNALTNSEVTVTGDGFVTGSGAVAAEGADYNVTGSQKVAGSSVNSFTYTLNEGTKADNYNITKVEGTLTVTSREAKYEISPQAESGTVMYDGEEHTVSGFVTDTFEVDGNTYKVSGLTAEGSGTDAGSYPVNVSGTAVVKDSDGADVSDEFSVTPQTETLTINKRNVTLTSATDSKEYDGAALTNDTVTVSGDGFASGEGAQYDVTGTRTVAGTSENSFTYTLNDNTKANNYDITTSYGTLTVNSRNTKYEVTLKAKSLTEKYDGTAKSVTGYTIDGREGSTFTASNGKTYTISGMTVEASGTDAGTYTVNITGTPTIKDSADQDVTEQFTVSVESGTLTIDKRVVTLTSDTASKAYDGKPLASEKVTVGGDGFAEGESADYAFTGSQTLPGESDNTFTYELVDAKPGNYDITTSYGKLTVNERNGEGDGGKYKITVKANSGTFTYDGKEHTVTGFETLEYIINDVTYTVSGISASGSLTDAGETAVEITGTPKVADAQGNDLTGNFTIVCEDGKLTVKKCPQEKPDGLSSRKASSDTVKDGVITGFDEKKLYEYSEDEGTTWTKVDKGATEVTGIGAGDVLVRYQEDDNRLPGEAADVSVGIKENQAAPLKEDFVITNASEEDASDGEISGVDDTMEYSLDGGKNWTPVEENQTVIDKLPVGDTELRYKGDKDKNPGKSLKISIGVTSRTQGIVNFKTDESAAPVETSVESAQSSNIEDFAATQMEEGKDVKVELEIIPQKEEDVSEDSVTKINDTVKEVFAGIESESIVTEYLEIDLAKYVDNAKEGNISDTKAPLEIELTYDKSKTGNPVIIRTHNGVVKAFEKLMTRPAGGGFRDGTYHVADGKIYLYSQYFSDFAIVYATEKTYYVNIDMGNGESIQKIVGENDGIEPLADQTREGYSFGGLYKDASYKDAWNYDTDKVNEDITLYGKWNKLVSGVSVTPESIKLTKAGETSQIKVSVTPEDAANTKVTYKSSDTKVATVDASGKITAVANGTATITITTDDGAKTATVEVTVAISDVPKQETSEQSTTEQPKTTEQPLQKPIKEEKAEISMNAGLKISQTGSKINIKWGKVKEADGYKVYVTYCGMDFNTKKPNKTLKKNSLVSTTITKINGKKINLKKNYKIYVVAYKMVDGKKVKLAKTIMGHIVGRRNSKYSNVRKITLSKSKYSVKVGKTVKVKAKTVLVEKGKKQLSDAHAKEFRYASSNKHIATVDKNGKVKGVAKGTCTIYVYARNGYAKKVKVTVK